MRHFTIFCALLCAPALVSSQQQKPKDSPSQPAQKSDQTADIDPSLADAEASIASSDWKAASTKLDAYLANHANDARALFDAGYVADHQDQLDRAAGFYRQSIEADHNSFESHLALGLLLARQGKRDEAHTELSTATTLNPGQAGSELKATAWRNLARLDKPGPDGEGNAKLASDELLEALKLSPGTPADTLLAADLAEDTGDHQAAEKAYRRVLAGDPKSVGANSGLAHVLIEAKQYPEAEKLVRSALQQEPDNPVLNAQLATVLAAQNNSDALPLLQKLHTAHPDNLAITSMLADVLAEAGDLAGSDKLYTALLAKNPDDISLLVSHGQNLVRQQQYAQALAVFDKATKLDSGSADSWTGIAFCASKLHQPSLAIHALTMRSKFIPDVPATYFLWATSYDTLNDRVAAITYYHHFLESSGGKFPDQEWQAKQRLLVLEKKR
ncbi:tetratricopeptide repeat protein [Occallatibacter savannae]|uniref:tetratricopeptide repeat protein n=1 Tax=Occallatibacter savannae TaxID=1002691 RepID=UPI0013A58D2A|nr:tetratricopeptide repeat protein [Occallatibacter savannae]